MEGNEQFEKTRSALDDLSKQFAKVGEFVKDLSTNKVITMRRVVIDGKEASVEYIQSMGVHKVVITFDNQQSAEAFEKTI